MNQNRIVAVVFAVLAVTGAAAAIANTTPTQGTVPVADGDAPVVYITGGKNIQFDGFGPDQTRTQVDTDSGSIGVTGADSGRVTVDQMEGTFTNVSEIDTGGEIMDLDPGDKLPVRVNDGVTALDFRNGTIDDGAVDMRYEADSGANISIAGLPAGAGAGAIDADSGQLLDNAQADSNGRVVFDDLPSGTHSVLIQKAPQDLSIREETNPSQLITGAEVDIRFYIQGDSGSTDQVSRTTTTGQIDMTGLPKNESFVVSVSAENYNDRQIFVDNLYEQQSVYLLNKNETTVTKTFEYTDFSGDFPQEDTVILFERPINDQFKTVSGDVIGATGEYRVTLDQNQRHRIILYNRETGERRTQGPFTPLVSGANQIEVYSQNEIDITGLGPVLQFSPSTAAVREATVTFETDITERANAIDSTTVTLYRRTGGQLTMLQQNTTSGAGSVVQTANLTGYNSSTAVIEVEYTLSDGTTDTKFRNYSVNKLYNNQNSLISVLGGFDSQIAGDGLGAFQTIVGLLVSLLLAAGASSRVRLSGTGFGVVMVAGMSMFSVVGWISYGVVFAAGVTLVALVFLRRGL